MRKIKFDDIENKILGIRFDNEQSFHASKSAIASSSYEGFKPNNQSVRKIRDVVEGKMSREQLILLIKSESSK